MSEIGKLRAAAVAKVEAKLRAAIARLGDQLTDIEIAVYADERLSYCDLEEEIRRHIFTLRFTIASNRHSGLVMLSARDEAALRASTRKLPPPPKVVEGILEDPSTITPSPAPMKQLGARRPRGVRVKAPEGPSRVVAVGGHQLLMLGAGDPKRRT